MTDYTRGPEKGPTDGIGLPHDAYRLGVDAAGREHWHSPWEDRVWVLRDGDLVHERDVYDIVRWVLFIEQELSGWEAHEPVAETDGLRGLVDDIERKVA